jgi:hypothetical protein
LYSPAFTTIFASDGFLEEVFRKVRNAFVDVEDAKSPICGGLPNPLTDNTCCMFTPVMINPMVRSSLMA